MQKAFRVYAARTVYAALFFTPFSILAQPSSGPGADPAQQAALQGTQAVSQTGVFPEFAVNMNFDPSQVDGADVPSKSANGGVDDTIQRAWEALKPGGFNTIVFKVDLNDPQAAARVANLCIWAKANSVALIPVLANAFAGEAAASFPGAVISLLRGGDGQQFAAYTQLSYFQIQDPINVPLAGASMKPTETQKKLLGAVDSLRSAESQALQGAGVQATPIIVSASFDYELIQQGAIAGVQLDATTEQKAQAALKKTLLPFADAANVDAISVSWFPRSITSGDEGHFVGLLRELEGAVPGKKVLLDTGFSTAFNSGDQQSQFMTVALTNLAGFRATDGADSRFVGVTISQAFDNSAGKAQASPAGPSDPGQWNWSEKAKQLAQMWSKGGKSADLTWWLEKVRAGRALLTAQANASGGNDMVASPGLQAVQQFSATVAQVSQNMTPATISSTTQTPPSTGQALSSPDTTASSTMLSQAFVPPTAAMPANGAPAPPTATQTAGSGTPSFYSQMLQTLVQQVTTQLTTAMVTKLSNKLTNSSPAQPQYPSYAAQNGGATFPQTPNANTNYNVNPQAPQYPVTSPSSVGVISLGPQDVTLDTANPAAGQPVHVTAQLHNGSTDQDIAGLTVQLVDAANLTLPQASQSGVVVSRLGIVPVQLTWTAGQPTGAPSTLLVQVLDASGAQVASAGVPTITIANANAGPNSGNTTNQPPYGSNSGSSNGQTAQNTTSGNFNANPGSTTNMLASGSNPVSSTTQSQPGQALASSNTQSGTATEVVQPQIVFFGPAATTGQTPSLSLQVTNPAASLMSSAQAQLFVDGKPGPVQTLGPLLPSQTRSATFDSSTVAAGTHNIKVVVTTADGASASATASPAASLGPSHSVGVNNLTARGVRGGLPVRSGLPASYQIGTVTTAPASASAPPPQTSAGPNPPRTAAPNASATGSQKPPAASQSGAISTIASPNRANLPAGTSTTPTVGSSQTGSGSTPAVLTRSPSQTGGVRTITPQGSSGTNQAGTVSRVVPPGSSGQTPGVRTVVPQTSTGTNQTGAVSTVLAPASSGQTPGVRTVVPQVSTGTNQTGTVSTVLPPASSGQAPAVRTVVPQTSTGANRAGTVTTALPPASSGQTTGVRTVLPPGAAGANQAGSVTTAVPAGSSSSIPAVRAVVPRGSSTTNQTTTVATTVLPPRPVPGTGITMAVAPGPGTTHTVAPTTVLPPGRTPAGTTLAGPLGLATGNSVPGRAYLDLSITAGEIGFRPVAPGQPTTFTAVIHNLGTVGAQGASVVFTLNADGRITSSRPSVFNIAAGGSFQASWTAPMPAGRSVQLGVQVMANGDINPANNQAAIRLH
jgi:hypothetical protein